MISPTELSEAIIASLIIARGLIASASAALRLPSGDRTPIWFGLFGCLYGARLAGHSELVQPFFPEAFWRYLDAFITYTIIVPAVCSSNRCSDPVGGSRCGGPGSRARGL